MLSLPKGGGAISGIGEKFAANPVTGTGSVSVPMYTSPGRSGFGPQLQLTYDSGSGNGPFGFGWSLALPTISRKTDKGLPQYGKSEIVDTFMLAGAEDLVPVCIEVDGDWVPHSEMRTMSGATYRIDRYRPGIETQFASIERWSNQADSADVFWRTISKENVTSWFGVDAESRVADPANPERIFSWLLSLLHDDKGSVARYRYRSEDSVNVPVSDLHERNRDAAARGANIYLKRVQYGNRTPFSVDPDAPLLANVPEDWCFELVLDYGDHAAPTVAPDSGWACRDDPFSTYRSGFEVRTYRLCRRLMMFHHFPDDVDTGDACLVRSTDLRFTEAADADAPHFSLLASVSQTGYRRVDAGYESRSTPPVEFEYSKAVIDQQVRTVGSREIDNLPTGIDGNRYQWVDLHGEGISGVLSERSGAWLYKRNLSPAPQLASPSGDGIRFGPPQLVEAVPSFGAFASGRQLIDLDGDGALELVEFGGGSAGYFEQDGAGEWRDFVAFKEKPVIDWSRRDLKFIDLTGDGHADILMSEDDVFCWHRSKAKDGFSEAAWQRTLGDEEVRPRTLTADHLELVSFADMSGDGLADIVRVRNGSACYWPNLGYGRFGSKVEMDASPRFDHPDHFQPERLRLTDIDGSGTTDILYLSARGAEVYFNLSGNRWSDGHKLDQYPPSDSTTSTMVADLKGNGTACLIWSSPLVGDENRLDYIDLMGDKKPHLLIGTRNNLGAETRIRYAPSTRFYLEDEFAGRPWITKIPFPVHVVEQVEVHDRISRNRFATRYAYHHGYFDGMDREFRGFGMVEQWDSQAFASLSGSELMLADNENPESNTPPILTKSWFHTGAYFDGQSISDFFGGFLNDGATGEYYRPPGIGEAEARALLLPDTIFDDAWDNEERRQACRALKGSMLRQEIYALDGSDKQPHPYTVAEQNFTVDRLQPRVGEQKGVFFVHPREALNTHYERDPADPRIAHTLTLDVDDYGNVRQALSLQYGRQVADAALSAADQIEQSRPIGLYTVSSFTNAVETPDAYRGPVGCDTKTYEIIGLASSGRTSFDEWTDTGFAKFDQLVETPYELSDPADTPAKRLIERVCTLFRSDDLATDLPLGSIESTAIPAQAYKLALTQGLVDTVFQRDPATPLMASTAHMLAGQSADQGGYVDLFSDQNWWIPSGRSYFAAAADIANPATTASLERATAKAGFYTPLLFVSPFGAVSTIAYDINALFPTAMADGLGNVTKVAMDYRVLQPRQLTDPNGNRSQAAFDTLGLLAGMAVQGKEGEGLGDSLVGFAADLSDADLDAFFTSANPRDDAQALLGPATMRVVSDQSRFYRTRLAHPDDPDLWQPAFAATLTRETHVSALGPGDLSPVQLAFGYSDGFGREIQKKIQAEAGPLSPGGDSVAPRWVGSGWTIFNNKGKPVRQYEPFFTGTHRFEFAREEGISPVLFYDPAGRVVATLHPDHSWEKLVFDSWRQESWDGSDTVLIADPKTDADVGDYFARLPDADYLPSWHDARADGSQGSEAKLAAEQTAIHAATPSLVHIDVLGRPFLSIAHNAWKTGPMASTDPRIEQHYETRTELDVEGNQRAVIDAMGRIVMRFDYDMLGRQIAQHGMDGGSRWTLPDVAGNPIRGWDMRGHDMRATYDALRRPLTTHIVTDAGGEALIVETVYGETQPTPEADNLRGKAYRLFDQAGMVTTPAYDFKGNVLTSSRQLTQEYKATIDWGAPVPLEPEIFATQTGYDALNRPIAITTPDGSIIHPGFNEANLLERVDVQRKGATPATPFVANIDYDAKGQRAAIMYGNGATTRYGYDPQTYRLVHLRTERSGFAVAQSVVQDLRYTYDIVGNVAHIRDDAQQVIFFDNQLVEPSCSYIYDAVHRLIEASGREHLGQIGGQAGPPAPSDAFDYFRRNLPQPGDGNAMGTYIERYAYDAVGNILEMQHRGSSPAHAGWARSFSYASPSLVEAGKTNNRLTATGTGSGAADSYTYDTHGNMLAMPHLPLMAWNERDQLRASTQTGMSGGGTPETTYYVYDAGGERVRKVTERQAGPGQAPTCKQERIYLAGYETYRDYASDGTTVDLERETLHVMDDQRRIALVETRTAGNDGSPTQLIRYQMGNHLGSASLELDDAAALISYEEYTPYGSTSYHATRSQQEAVKRYRYTGKERDEETGLNYHSARYYAPWLSRWVSADPIGIGDGVNLYEYCHCRPSVFIDYPGTQTTPPWVASSPFLPKDFLKNAYVRTVDTVISDGVMKITDYTKMQRYLVGTGDIELSSVKISFGAQEGLKAGKFFRAEAGASVYLSADKKGGYVGAELKASLKGPKTDNKGNSKKSENSKFDVAKMISKSKLEAKADANINLFKLISSKSSIGNCSKASLTLEAKVSDVTVLEYSASSDTTKIDQNTGSQYIDKGLKTASKKVSKMISEKIQDQMDKNIPPVVKNVFADKWYEGEWEAKYIIGVGVTLGEKKKIILEPTITYKYTDAYYMNSKVKFVNDNTYVDPVRIDPRLRK